MQIQMDAALQSDSGKVTRGTIVFTNEYDIALDIVSEIAQVIKRRGWELNIKFVPETEDEKLAESIRAARPREFSR